ncbi:MAG TPA: tetratricopeptide repeat protein [Candidatus Acidoferrum sp.]|nr:tetratricopeptide repeat protein [Candidatus Acidoferrum sp.]
MRQKLPLSIPDCKNLRWLFFSALLFATPVFCQDRSADQSGIRGNRAEVAITIKEGSSQLIGPLVTVKLFYLGSLNATMTTTKGRAVFILNRLGDYTITAEAIGYRSAQREISVPVAVEAEEEIVLQRDSSPEALGNAGRPVLAPKAKEAFDKGLQALGENKLDQAEKYLAEAIKLAPNHPDVLYLQGIILLRRGQPEQAQSALEKVTQIDPQNSRAFTALGMAFLNENKQDLAIAPLKQSIQLDPSNWEAHWTLARALYRGEQFDACLAEAQQALSQSHGGEPSVELLIAQAQTAVGKFEDSAETLRTFLRLHPNDKGAANARRWLDRLIADGKVRK